MTSAAMKDLLELQRVDTELDRLAHQRRMAPEHAALDAALGAVRQAAARRATAHARLGEIDEHIAADEGESKSLGTTRDRLQAQLRTVIAPREAEALMHEIEAVNTRRSELDDDELAYLEEQEQLTAEVSSDEADEPARVQAASDAQAALDAVLAELDGKVAAAQADRVERAGAVPTALLGRYERLRASLGGVAVARLDGRQCTGCHLELSPAELDELTSTDPDAIVECPQCSRLLVR